MNRDQYIAILRRVYPEWDYHDLWCWINSKWMRYGGEPDTQDIEALLTSLKYASEKKVKGE